MKKHDAETAAASRTESREAAAGSFFSRLLAPIGRLGIRGRVFLYFLVFTAALLTLLWVFQIALLPDFYKLQKTNMLTSSMDTIAKNIDNEDLQLLADRLTQTNEVCVLIVNSLGERIVSTNMTNDCVINHLSAYDLNRYIDLANQKQTTVYRTFSLGGFTKSDYDADHFQGPVPRTDDGRSRSMVAIRNVETETGENLYVFLNALITPVDATVQTLRSQYLFIAILMVALSFIISLFLSRRIALPIIDTNEAAVGLSEGSFKPAKTSASYREIRELNATLIQAAKDLRRVEAMQRELIANISHDLRTPLTLIEGYAEAMRDLPGENKPENMQVIIDETRRLTSLVNAVLEYSAGKSGNSPVEPCEFSLTDGIRGILGRYQKLTELDGYHIRFDYTKNVTVFADEMRIGQVVYNLINNALTYSGEDKTVVVTQRVADGVARVEVTDTGEGIAEEELPYIFSRYYRGQKPHKRAAVGTGLGLSIVKGILDAHRLQYGVNSQLGAGTTFWFELPVLRATDIESSHFPDRADG